MGNQPPSGEEDSRQLSLIPTGESPDVEIHEAPPELIELEADPRMIDLTSKRKSEDSPSGLVKRQRVSSPLDEIQELPLNAEERFVYHQLYTFLMEKRALPPSGGTKWGSGSTHDLAERVTRWYSRWIETGGDQLSEHSILLEFYASQNEPRFRGLVRVELERALQKLPLGISDPFTTASHVEQSMYDRSRRTHSFRHIYMETHPQTAAYNELLVWMGTYGTRPRLNKSNRKVRDE